MLRLFPGPTAGTLRNLQHRRSHARTLRMRSRCGVRIETRQPRHHCGTHGLTATQSRPADGFRTAAVPGRSAALDVCVASPNAARGPHRRHLTFDRKLSNCRNEIPDLRNQCIHCRPSQNGNTTECSRHRVQSEWPADVSEIASAQMET